MQDVVTFGEAMIRLSPRHFQRLEQASDLEVAIGGTELNVAVALSRLGISAAFVSRLPNNPLGRMVANKAREHGVDISHIVWTDTDRLGLYFLERGASPRPSSVLYDRAHSALSHIRQKDINWKPLLAGTRIFHTTGITAALSRSAAQVALKGLHTAKSLGVTTSLDLNYRAKLWSEAEAQRVMSLFMPYTDILFTTEEDTYRVFKITGKNYAAVARKLHQRFKLKIVAITLRQTPSVWHNRWTAIAFAKGKLYEDITYDLEIVDRIGSGDAFTAGFLFGLLSFENDIQKALHFGNALAALKHSIPGDLSWITRAEAEKLLGSSRSLRISR